MLIGNRKQTILIHDGASWHVVVLARSGGAWAVRAVETVASRNGSRLPEELLAVAVSQHAKRVTALLPGDVHAVRFQAPPDAEPEEMQTALRFESAGEFGAENGDLRVAAARADALNLDVDADSWLVAGLGDARLRAFSQAVVDQGLRFAGAGSFELAALAWLHMRVSGDARLLLLKENTAFYAAPALGDTPLVVATLPVGTRPDQEPERDRERLERAARRLATHGDIPLTVLSCGPASEATQARLAGLFPSPDSVEWHSLNDIIGDLARLACTPRRSDSAHRCPVVGPTPPPRDPHRAGTWLFFLILLVTVAGVGGKFRALVAEEAALTARKQRWAELQAARKTASERIASLRQQRDEEIAAREVEIAARQAEREAEAAKLRARREEEAARLKAFRDVQALPPGLLLVLDTLTEAMPPYTRIERLAEAEAGPGLALRGSTRWQPGLGDLVRALNEVLRPCGLIVQQDALELAEAGRGEQVFTYRIVPMEAAP
jgi:Tfp pilus assembly protein PilN